MINKTILYIAAIALVISAFVMQAQGFQVGEVQNILLGALILVFIGRDEKLKP